MKLLGDLNYLHLSFLLQNNFTGSDSLQMHACTTSTDETSNLNHCSGFRRNGAALFVNDELACHCKSMEEKKSQNEDRV